MVLYGWNTTSTTAIPDLSSTVTSWDSRFDSYYITDTDYPTIDSGEIFYKIKNDFKKYKLATKFYLTNKRKVSKIPNIIYNRKFNMFRNKNGSKSCQQNTTS